MEAVEHVTSPTAIADALSKGGGEFTEPDVTVTRLASVIRIPDGPGSYLRTDTGHSEGDFMQFCNGVLPSAETVL
jgi:hypothetical protein